MKKLFPLILIALFMCWSLAFAEWAQIYRSNQSLTSDVIGEKTFIQVNSSDATKVFESKTVFEINTKAGFLQRPTILTNYLFDDFEDGDYTANPTWTMTSNGGGTTEDWAIKPDPWTYTWGTVTHNGSGYIVGSDSDAGGGLTDEELSISFNTPGGGGNLTLYYWLHFRAYDGSAEYFRVLVDGTVVDSVQAEPIINPVPIQGDRLVILDSYNDGNPHTLTMHYYAYWGYVAAFDDVVITDDSRLGACCNDNNGACVDSVEQAQCPTGVPGVRWVLGTLCADLYPPCGTIFGACCDDQGNCTQTAQQDCQGTWLEDIACVPNICPVPAPCTLSCPPNGIAEGEPDCYDGYVDNYNGGCNSTPPVFTSANVGDTICGLAGDYFVNGAPRRDTDWYELTITTDNTLYYYGTAEYDFQLLIIDAGSGTCTDYAIVAGASFEACSTGVVSAPVCPGTYYLWAGENSDTWVNCGSPYVIWTELGPPPTGACCVDTNCVATNTICECEALDGNWYIGDTCPDFDCPILVDCEDAIWHNGPFTGNLYAVQCDPVYPMQAGVADDFMFTGSDSIPHLDYVIAWFGHWGHDPEATPADYVSVNVTIYANDDSFTPNRPGGKPIDGDVDCTHTELITGGIVYFLTLNQGQFGYVLDAGGIWRLMLPVDITLECETTYWLEVQPELVYQDYGQSGWCGSTDTWGTCAEQIFELLGTLEWGCMTNNPDVAFCLRGMPCSFGCDYVVGDVNGTSSYNGLDITYGVAYFKGGNDPFCEIGSCGISPCDAFFYCGDVNGTCSYNGLDITYGVAYFKGGALPFPCPQCPPN